MKYIYAFLDFILSVSGFQVWKFTTNYAVDVTNYQTNLLMVDLKTEPISVAVLGLTGIFDLKEDMSLNNNYTWEVLITNGGTDDVTYHFPVSPVTEFFDNIWNHSFVTDMKKCSNMPTKLPFLKKTYRWFKCIFPHLTIDFIEATVGTPQRYQKMRIFINKNGNPVSRMVFHMWGSIDGQSKLGEYNMRNFFHIGDMFGNMKDNKFINYFS